MTCSTRSARWGLLLPDPALQGAAQVLPNVAQNGPTTPVFSATLGNVGGAVPIGADTPKRNYAALFDDYEIRTSRTGKSGPTGNAGFVYKRAAAASDRYKGVDDYRRLWFGDSPNENPITAPAFNDQSIVYLPESNRVAIFHIAADGVTFRRYTTPAEESSRAWSSVTMAVPGVNANTPGFRIGITDMPDKSLLMAVLRDRGTPITTYDTQIYRSTDEGVTWVRIGTAAEFLFAASPARVLLVRSGPWVVLAVSANYYLTSGDGGATWSSDGLFVGAAGSVNNVTVNIPPNVSSTPPDSAPFDVCALDDRGNFALVYRREGGNTVYVWRKRGNQPWTYVPGPVFHAPSTPATPYDKFKTVSLTTNVYKGTVHVVIACRDSAAGPAEYFGNQIMLVQLDVATLRKVDTTPLTRFVGSEVVLAGMRSTVAAGRLWVSSGAADLADLGVASPVVRVFQIGGWTSRSLGTQERPAGVLGSIANASYEDTLWRAQWMMSLNKRPVAAAANAWTRSETGVAQEVLTSVRRLRMDVSNPANHLTYTHVIATAGNGTLLKGGGFEAVMTARVISAGSTGTPDGATFKIDASDGATESIALWVLCRTTGITVYRDKGAGPPSGPSIATLTFDTTASVFEVRVAMRFREPHPTLGSIYDLVLSAARVDALDSWSAVSASVTITGVPVGEHGGDRVTFGVFEGDCEADFYDVAIAQYSAFVQSRAITFQNPTNLLGYSQTSEPVYLENGVSVRFGGGSTFLGDSWTSDTYFVHGVENLFTASPRRFWASDFTNAEAGTAGSSDALASQTITLDADPTGIGTRFEHTGIYFGGSSERNFTVKYSDDPSPAAAGQTFEISAAIASGLTVEAAGPGSFTFNAPAASIDPRPGEWVDCFVRFTSGVASGRAYRVKMNSQARRIHIDDPSGLVAGVSAGAGFEVISPSTMYAYDAPARGRYLHITLDDAYTGTGDHRIGALVVGTYLRVNIPLNWTFQDIETERTTPTLTAGGDYWAKEDAPAVRAITGEMVGDIDRTREGLRYLLRATSRYNLRTAVLVLDQDIPRNHVYGVWQGGSPKANTAKMKFDDGEGLYDVGDTTITFQEIK